MWELKALAIREQKTFVIQPPVFAEGPTSIYVDFEGISDENHIYLIGVLIVKDGQPDETLFGKTRMESFSLTFIKIGF